MYHKTLNDALEAVNMLHVWDIHTAIGYDKTVAVIKDGQYVSVYRDNRGLYETPIHYATMCDDNIIHYN